MAASRNPSGRTTTESNKQAYARYRTIMERDLAGSWSPVDTGEEWSLNIQIAAQWMARYVRRRDLLDAQPGWGIPLADTTGRDALLARNLARDAAYPQLPVWDDMTQDMIAMTLRNGRSYRLDVTSLGEPTRYGPSLRRLWAEATARGLSGRAAWDSIAAWANHRPAAWDRDDERKRRRRPLHDTGPGSRWERPAVWQKTDDLDAPWAAEADSERWQVRLNDFPDDHLYTLLVNGEPAGDFDNWPDAWDRGDRPAATAVAPAPPRARRPAAAVDSEKWLDRYLAGQYAEVWAELMTLGEDVRSRRYRTHAVAVARETMRRARHNVETIIRTLDSMGYAFGDGRGPRGRGGRDHLRDDSVLLRPGPDEAALLDEWEREGTVLPLSLRMWLEEVGRVDLCGSLPPLCYLEREAGFPGVYADPLMVAPTASDLEDFLGLASEEGHVFVSFDAWGKSAIGGPDEIDSDYLMVVPDGAADGLLIGERHNITFVEYLRLSFQWGGFPGWEGQERVPERELARLRQGLLPL